MSTLPDSVLDAYLHLTATLPTDSKLALINRLSAEIRRDLAGGFASDRFAQAFGTWQSAETAEEIIEGLRASRLSSNRQIESF